MASKPIEQPPKKPKAKTGRKGKFSDVEESLLAHLRVGHTDKDACALVGISAETLYTWLKEKPEFSESVKKARMVAKDQCIKIIRRAGLKSWMAAAWYLERRFRDEYSTKHNVTHDGAIVSLTDTAAKTAAKYKKPTANGVS